MLLQKLEANLAKTQPQIPKYKKKHRIYTNFFEMLARTFAFFPVEKTCSDEPFLLWVDFGGWISVLWKSGRALRHRTKGRSRY